MSRLRKANRKHQNRHNGTHNLSCEDCGHVSGGNMVYEHSTPTRPDLAGMGNVNLPTMGAESLYIMLIDPTWPSRVAKKINVGDFVKLDVPVTDTEMPWLPQKLQYLVGRFGLETMWVRVTKKEGKVPNVTFEGELWSVPILISPEQLELGSRITFDPIHVISHMEETRGLSLATVPASDEQ